MQDIGYKLPDDDRTVSKHAEVQTTQRDCCDIYYYEILVYLLVNLLNPTGYVMHQQFNIQQLYVLPTLYLCVLYLSENKQRLVPLTA